MKIKIQKLNERNKNGRIYSTEVISNALENLSGKTLYATLGVQSDASVNLVDVAGSITNLKIEDDYLVGDMRIASTPSGKILEQSCDGLVFRPCGIGRISETGEITEYTITSISIVSEDNAS